MNQARQKALQEKVIGLSLYYKDKNRTLLEEFSFGDVRLSPTQLKQYQDLKQEQAPVEQFAKKLFQPID